MKNLHLKPQIEIPKRCPKCGGPWFPCCTQIGEDKFVHSYICHRCGETSDGYEVKK